MTLAKRTKGKERERWDTDPNKAVSYEFDFKGQLVKPGQKFKLKNDRNVYTFHCLVHNVISGTTWIEATSTEGFHSFRPEKVFKLIGIKRSYAKNVS